MGQLPAFRHWLLTRRNLSPDTADRYVLEIQKMAPLIEPTRFLRNYEQWSFNATRVYVHFLYQVGIINSEVKFRWLDLIKIPKSSAPEPVDITAQEIIQALKSTPKKYRPLMDFLYFSGIRVIEALEIMNSSNHIESVDLPNGCVRLNVKWSRGSKHCNYAYLPWGLLPFTPLRIRLDNLSGILGFRPKIFRKFFYRTAKAVALENRLDPMIADFYQSRVSSFTIGAMHYDNLRSDADRLYPMVVEKLQSMHL